MFGARKACEGTAYATSRRGEQYANASGDAGVEGAAGPLGLENIFKHCLMEWLSETLLIAARKCMFYRVCMTAVDEPGHNIQTRDSGRV
jgi:hypothetical protein